MSRRKITVEKQDLELALSGANSTSQAASRLGLTYQTFQRRCQEFGIELKPNPSGKGLSYNQRYDNETAFRMKGEISQRSKSRICSEKTRAILRDKALQRIDDGKMPSKGLKGYYKGIWFDSGWELAYFIWMSEVINIEVRRNKEIWFDYADANGIRRRTKPDFILPNGELVEIKGYPNIHTESKFEATKDRVKFLFRSDMKNALDYVTDKYGKDFTKKFYASVL